MFTNDDMLTGYVSTKTKHIDAYHAIVKYRLFRGGGVNILTYLPKPYDLTVTFRYQNTVLRSIGKKQQFVRFLSSTICKISHCHYMKLFRLLNRVRHPSYASNTFVFIEIPLTLCALLQIDNTYFCLSTTTTHHKITNDKLSHAHDIALPFLNIQTYKSWTPIIEAKWQPAYVTVFYVSHHNVWIKTTIRRSPMFMTSLW